MTKTQTNWLAANGIHTTTEGTKTWFCKGWRAFSVVSTSDTVREVVEQYAHGESREERVIGENLTVRAALALLIAR